ncbi:MAG: DHH family phosphoesterase, partial [Oscillospiraceae bacterium]
MEQAHIPPLVSAVLAARGVDADAAAALLSAEEDLCDPMLLRDADRAAKTISEAIENGEYLCVFGDYDCDGVAATAMVTDYLEACGARVCYYIPHREKEGYGLNIRAIDDLARLGVTLILTVDNGVTAIDEIAYAYTLGMRVVVTDHHQPRETLPQAEAVVNPHRADCLYPDKNLSGVGVAFKLLCALEGERGWCLLEQYAELLALGTVADVVELTGENRCFVRRGLRAMRDTQRPGLRALIQLAGMDPEKLTAESIAFGLAPRINAAGRIDTAELAVMLLKTESEEEAQELAEQLEALNMQRRALEKQVVDDLAVQLQNDPLLGLRRVMVLSGTGWNAGVVGIVCSRLVERFDRPV